MLFPATIAFLVLIFSAPVGFAQAGSAQNPLAQFSASIRELTRRASPAVVEISISGYAIPEEGNRTAEQVSRQLSNGSGVLVDSSGYIMTNAHVIQYATAVKVLVGAATDGTRAGALESPPPRNFDAHVVGMDKESDLALLRIDAAGLPALEFGDSDALSQGDVVLAIGSPMLLRNSLSMGVVSAPARAIGTDDPVLYIQTDASINPGESGGALIDINGRLIGLNTSILSKSGGSEGIGFAIPGNLVRTVYRQLRDKGSVSSGSLGVLVQNITPALAKGLSLHTEYGVVVADLDPDGSGSFSGLQRDDVILSLDDAAMQSARQFNEAVYRRQAGEKVRLLVQRGEETFSTNAKVDSHVSPLDPLTIADPVEQSLVSRLGIFCIEIDKRVVEAMPQLRTQYGLVIVAQSGEGRAKALDLKPGDVIHELNRLPIASLDLFRTRIDELRPGDAVALRIERDGHFRYTSFDIQ
jgi:serine protease Do